jgi:osmotically inducible protein OsmC
MKEITRHARAHWAGGLMDGRGTTSTGSKTIDEAMYSVPSRFENGTGTNPEELIAAAEASCFSMMLAKILSDQHKTVDEINTTATVVLRQENGSAKISEIRLETNGTVAGIAPEDFRKAAEQAKENCPVSKLLSPGLEKITLDAKLVVAQGQMA